VVADLHPGIEPRLSGEAVSDLALDMALILAGGASPLSRDEVTDAISDAEADGLFPPRTAAERDRRAAVVEAARRELRDIPTEELHARIYGGDS